MTEFTFFHKFCRVLQIQRLLLFTEALPIFRAIFRGFMTTATLIQLQNSDKNCTDIFKYLFSFVVSFSGENNRIKFMLKIYYYSVQDKIENLAETTMKSKLFLTFVNFLEILQVGKVAEQ